MNILALNGGSSTIKAAFFADSAGELQREARWNVTRQGDDTGLAQLVAALPGTPAVVVHRVVHGADDFAGATLLTDEVITRLRTLVSLAPLHQPFNLDLVDAARSCWPQASHVACFDTAFHQTQTDLARRYALPRELHERGIKRYGFHGLSYAYVSRVFFAREPQWRTGRVVIAHLGSGASACAIHQGVSVASSMGFSALAGLVMGTRCGDLDPGVLLHLLREGKDVQQLETLLYKQSGLLGVSGISADLRELLVHASPSAQEAVMLFVSRCCEVIAQLAARMQGLDALVFTGGIGEHQADTRALIMAQLGWLGVVPDSTANACSAWQISAESSAVGVFVVPTDEEREMAQEARSILR